VRKPCLFLSRTRSLRSRARAPRATVTAHAKELGGFVGGRPRDPPSAADRRSAPAPRESLIPKLIPAPSGRLQPRQASNKNPIGAPRFEPVIPDLTANHVEICSPIVPQPTRNRTAEPSKTCRLTGLSYDRGDRIRTCDRPAPSRVRYQTAPLPVVLLRAYPNATGAGRQLGPQGSGGQGPLRS
jgi:hypothetical protein